MTKNVPNIEINRKQSAEIKKQTQEFLARKPDNKITECEERTSSEIIEHMKVTARHDGVSPEKQSEIDRKEEFNKRQKKINDRARRWNRNDVERK